MGFPLPVSGQRLIVFFGELIMSRIQNDVIAVSLDRVAYYVLYHLHNSPGIKKNSKQSQKTSYIMFVYFVHTSYVVSSW